MASEVEEQRDWWSEFAYRDEPLLYELKELALDEDEGLEDIVSYEAHRVLKRQRLKMHLIYHQRLESL